MKNSFIILSIAFLSSVSLQSCNGYEKMNSPSKSELSEKRTIEEIYVEYDPQTNCDDCPHWILITSNNKEIDRKTAERIYIKNQQNSKMNELNHLYEKQKPLTIRLNGEYKTESINKYRVFEYSKYQVIEL